MDSKISEFERIAAELTARYPGELSFLELGPKLQSAYSKALKPECNPTRLKGLTDDDLKAFFQAVFGVAFYSQAESDIRDLGMVFSEAERRKMDVLLDWNPRAQKEAKRPSQRFSMLTDLYRTYMRASMFTEARELGEKFPAAELPPPPAVKTSQGLERTNRVYDVDDTGGKLILKSLHWEKGPKIVTVFSPGCGFSREAIEDIETDPTLGPHFKEHGLFIASPNDITEWESYIGWNRQHSPFRGFIGYRKADWPDLDLAGTPQFYFYLDGKQMSQYGGWRLPSEERKAELARGLQSIGLKVAEAADARSFASTVATFERSLATLEARHLRDLPFRDFSIELLAKYKRLIQPEISPSKMPGLKDDDLKALFNAAQTVAFYSQAAPEVRDAERIFNEAERRRIDVRAAMTTKLYKTFVRAQMFDEARRLAERFPTVDVPHLPMVRVSTGTRENRRAYAIESDGTSMSLLNPPWHDGQRIVAVFSPGCRFSREAMAAVESDPTLLSTFKQHALLIAPPGDVLESQAHSDWNKAHPSLQGFVAHSMADWPELDLSNTPQFYFFQDGKWQSVMSGWRPPTEDRKAELIDGLRSIGLFPPRL